MMSNYSIAGKEVSGADIRRQVVERFLMQLTIHQPALYYAPTSQIAHAIHKQLIDRMNTLAFEEQQQLKSLTVTDIEVILSYHD